ncbi:hypothetical protein ATO49_04120 [Mycolicibacterium fortuitum subsp. fortuitum DSM 46621 = ATCC 6841 = JCM 6387]|nr:hypothetical protein ATO49_04120 [Mycolicibacterium fortuitum subsp. fortuitum DSM 46621 = ATCC 6841 = JCM 6387]
MFIVPCLEQRKPEQRFGERHWRALDRGCHVAGLGHRVAGAAQIVEGQLHLRIFRRLLVDLPVHLEEGGPERFGLSHHSADRPLKSVAVERARDFHE